VTILILRWSSVAALIGLLGVLSGCIVPGGDYGYDGGVAYGADYYEPYGAVYGGWGPGYRVGPVRDGGYRSDHGGGEGHAYRAAPASHSIPSIPSRSRSGGGRSR
jgi:hypothetical protein